jgi:hypothetical protein
MAGQGGPPRPQVSYAAAARPPSDADERELILVAVHGDVSKLDAVHVLQHLRFQKHYDANGKIEGFHSEANFNPADARRRFRMTFSSKGVRDTFVDMFRAPLTDAQKSALPDNLKHNAGPRLLVEWKSATGQLRCLIDIIEPRKRERILVVKVATVKPLVDDSVVAKKLEQYGTVDRIQRLHFRDFPLVENGVRLVFMKNLVASTFIPPSLFIAGQRVSVRYEGQWAITPCPNCKEKGHLRRNCPKPCSASNTRCQDTGGSCPGPAAAATTSQNGVALEGSSVQPRVQSVDEHEENMHDDASEPEAAAQPRSHQPTPVPISVTNVPTAATANPEFPSLGEAAAAATDFTTVRRKRKNGKKFIKKATLQLSDPSSSDSEPDSPPRRSPSPSSPKAKHVTPARGAKPRDGSPPSRRPR